MSRSWDQALSAWKDFSDCLRSTTLLHSMTNLQRHDQDTCRDALVTWAMVVSDSLVKLGLDTPGISEALRTIIMSTVSRMPIDLFIDFNKSVDEAILAESFRDSERPSESFKQIIRSMDARFSQWGDMLIRMSQWETSFISTFRLIHQVCSFLTRLNLTVPALEATALVEWIARQDALPRNIRYDGCAGVIRHWFDGFTLADPKPRNGNGSVFLDDLAQSTSDAYLKYTHAAWTPCMRYVDGKYFAGGLSHPFGYSRCDEPPSKLRFVPKSYKKVRSIAMEPSSKMWYQQAGFRLLDEYFKHHPVLRRRIHLHDATFNTQLAMQGSVRGEFSTIDLSAASDCVTWDWVKHCFIHTRLYPLLLAARTRSVVLPDGSLMELRSHATMGSALCFPVECIAFASMCESAILIAGDDPCKSRYVVYGDDIVIETKYVHILEALLGYYGHTVNPDKSYTDCCSHVFRESCGGEFLDGVDVTPLRISRKFSGYAQQRALHPEEFASLVQLANDCYLRFPTVRNWCIARLLRLPEKLRPLFGDEAGGILSDQPTNFHLLRHKTLSADYQRPVLVCGCVKQKLVDTPDDREYVRLYEWYVCARGDRARLHESVDENVQLPVVATLATKQGLCITSRKV